MDVARSAPQGAHYYHADFLYLLPQLGIKKGAGTLCYSDLSLHQLSSRPTVFIPRWTTHPCILYQVGLVVEVETTLTTLPRRENI